MIKNAKMKLSAPKSLVSGVAQSVRKVRSPKGNKNVCYLTRVRKNSEALQNFEMCGRAWKYLKHMQVDFEEDLESSEEV